MSRNQNLFKQQDNWEKKLRKYEKRISLQIRIGKSFRFNITKKKINIRLIFLMYFLNIEKQIIH